MWWALPTSDYCGGSVAIGLAPRRQSRISYVSDVQDGCRCPFRILEVAGSDPASVERVTGRRLSFRPVASAVTKLMNPEALDVSHRIQSELFTVWILGFTQCSVHHAIRVLANNQLDGFIGFRRSEHAVVPFAFRRQVGSTTQRYYAQPLPGFPGIVHAAMRRTDLGLLWGLRRHGGLPL